MKYLLLILILPLASCTVKPTIRSGQTIVTLGGSVFTKTAGEVSSYSGPLGTLSYTTASTDETIIPSKVANYYGVKALANAATAALRTTESTKRVLGAQEVSKNATNKAAEVETTRILNPVEEIPAPIPAP